MNKTPAVRFKGFTEDWEQRKLKEFGYSEGGTSIESEFSEKGKYKVISIGSYSEDSKYTDQGIRAIESDKTIRRILEQNDLTMILNDKTASGNIIGRVLFIDESNVFVYNQRTEMLRPNQDYYYPKFLYHLLNAPKHREKIIKQSQGNTQIYVNWSKISDITYMLPELGEQTNISNFYDQLDNLITNQQHKYEKLVNIKKSLLYKMFPQNDSKVPEIRFAGFTDDWEQQAFEKVFDYLQNNTLSRAELNNENGVAKNVHYGDVLIKYGEYLDISNSVLPYITSQQVTNRFRSSLLKNGDVVMADTAEDETVGKCTELDGISHYPIISGLHTIPLRPKIKFAAGYLGYYMNSSRYHNQLLPLIQGTKVSSISKNALKNTSILFPSITDEQRLIGQYFIQLDNLIIFHHRKFEKLKQIKQAMLHKMFV